MLETDVKKETLRSEDDLDIYAIKNHINILDLYSFTTSNILIPPESAAHKTVSLAQNIIDTMTH